jgi:hypothetical protein
MTKEVSKVGKNRNRNTGGRPKGTEKTGGRTKGTPNKKTLNFIDELGNFKPVQELLNLFAYTEDDNLKFAIIKEILKYVYPQRKAVEMTAMVEATETTQEAFLKHLKELGKNAD